MTGARLIESAFPLRQVSLDSVHEKNVRHGHVSTLHIWPARRPLAASRAALLATLLPAPDGREARRRLLERMAGQVVETRSATGERAETRGGIFRWGREGGPEVARFREEIREAFGGRSPRVLDPFAGGGAIPLEAMRLGCEAVAADINPVAWFLLRCTLHYPRLLAGKTRELPDWALEDREFAAAFLKAQGVTTATMVREAMARYGHEDGEGVQAPAPWLDAAAPEARAGFAWHLRAWGRRVLSGARRELARRYPTYAEFEPVRRKGGRRTRLPRAARYRPRQPRLLEPDEDGRASAASLNAEFDSLYLEDEANPRWVAKPAVAYLWARTVRCGGCRADVPLLKTRWLCKTAKKRVRLTMEPREDGAGVVFGIEGNAAAGGGSPAQKREHDRELGAGTMSGSGVKCPCCGAIVPMRDIRTEGRMGRLGERMTAVVVDGQEGKEYRLPTEVEVAAAQVGDEELDILYSGIPFGLLSEPTPKAGIGAARAFSVDGYGLDSWRKLFTNRQLLALGTFVREIRRNAELMGASFDSASLRSGRTGMGRSREGISPPTADRSCEGIQPRIGVGKHQHSGTGRSREGTSPSTADRSCEGIRPSAADGSGFPGAEPAGGYSEFLGAEPVGGYPEEWREALIAYLALSVSRPADYGSSLATWHNGRETIGHTFARFALPMVWDFAESNPVMDSTGGFLPSVEWTARVVEHVYSATKGAPPPTVLRQSAMAIEASGMDSRFREGDKDPALRRQMSIETSGMDSRFPHPDAPVSVHPERSEAKSKDALMPPVRIVQGSLEMEPGGFDLICTDPPYYDAIPYSDLMDFFHVWLRRALHGLSPETDAAFADPLGPKWDADAGDGELIDDASRFGGDRQASKRNYEDGMARAFARFHHALREDGRLVIVFANKQPDAWETLVSALIRAGFVVDGSWPIQTEMQTRQRSLSSAALSSSIWLVCKKRPAAARPGWDGRVLAEMQENIVERLRDFWDAGIRGPDFVWAATGPALEAFSRHPVVRKADREGERLSVAEFLRQVRRMVVGFVVSRLLQGEGGANDDLDDLTTYYLLHRNDFGLGAAPAGACILYALSCNLSDADLTGRLDLLARGGREGSAEDGEGEEGREISGSEARLKEWRRRGARDLGEPSAGGSPAPLIDRVHKLMQLWKTGEQSRVDGYLESQGLWRHDLFARVVQALIELAETGTEERSLLESIQNHVRTRGGAQVPRQGVLV